MRGRRERDRMKTSNLVLLAMGLFAMLFIVAMTVVFCVKDAVPDTLIQYTLGAGGVEVLLLAGIKLDEGTIPNVAGAVVSMASLVAYIITEGKIDTENAKYSVEDIYGDR